MEKSAQNCGKLKKLKIYNRQNHEKTITKKRTSKIPKKSSYSKVIKLLTDITKACCFTGHRELPQELNSLRDEIRFEIEKHYLINGVTTFISGGALGFDMLAAEEVVRAKSIYPEIKLIFALPCSDHTKKWSAAQAARLRVLAGFADETICLSEHYYSGCMHARNRFMLENSAYCISYCRKTSGGTYYTLTLAKKMGKTVSEI